MSNETKKILELFGSTDENIMFCDIVELNSKQSHLLLDYITNLQTIEREYSSLLSENAELQQENDRLNNIINELEEYIKPYLYMLNGIQNRDIYEQCQLDDFTDIMEKLQELKENNND